MTKNVILRVFYCLINDSFFCWGIINDRF